MEDLLELERPLCQQDRRPIMLRSVSIVNTEDPNAAVSTVRVLCTCKHGLNQIKGYRIKTDKGEYINSITIHCCNASPSMRHQTTPVEKITLHIADSHRVH